MGDDTWRIASCLVGLGLPTLRLVQNSNGLSKTRNSAESCLSLRAQGPAEPALPALQEQETQWRWFIKDVSSYSLCITKPRDGLCGRWSPLLPETLRSRMYSPRKHQERFPGCGVDADMLTFNYLRNTIGVYWYEEEVEAKETTQNLKPIVFKLQSLWECEFILVFPLQHFSLHTPLTVLPQEMMFYEARDFNIYSKRILSNRSKFEPLNPNYHTYGNKK